MLDSRLGADWIHTAGNVSQSHVAKCSLSFEPYCVSVTHVIPLEERLNVLITFRAIRVSI